MTYRLTIDKSFYLRQETLHAGMATRAVFKDRFPRETKLLVHSLVVGSLLVCLSVPKPHESVAFSSRDSGDVAWSRACPCGSILDSLV
jgi:hypothetical protein